MSFFGQDAKKWKFSFFAVSGKVKTNIWINIDLRKQLDSWDFFDIFWFEKTNIQIHPIFQIISNRQKLIVLYVCACPWSVFYVGAPCLVTRCENRSFNYNHEIFKTRPKFPISTVTAEFELESIESKKWPNIEIKWYTRGYATETICGTSVIRLDILSSSSYEKSLRSPCSEGCLWVCSDVVSSRVLCLNDLLNIQKSLKLCEIHLYLARYQYQWFCRLVNQSKRKDFHTDSIHFSRNWWSKKTDSKMWVMLIFSS